MATVKEAAKRHGKSESTIRRLARAHKLPAKKVKGRWEIGDIQAMHSRERVVRAQKRDLKEHPERYSRLPARASKAAHKRYAEHAARESSPANLAAIREGRSSAGRREVARPRKKR